jgi:hypothetical protein
MGDNLLQNARFEADWAEAGSHWCLVVPADGGPPARVERGNIFTPPGWVVWFRHGMPVEHDPANTVGWAQPEVRDAWVTGDPRRVREGQKASLFFTFFRIHDGGFLQQVQVRPGDRLRLDVWAHAWSNHKDESSPGAFPHPDDPRWSEGEGVGYNHFYALEGQVADGGARNFTFQVGIDPTGGTNPFADSVVWGQGAHVYNAYHQVPPVEVLAQGSTVTVFLRSRVLWPFKHCDAYWDDACLEVVEPAVWTQLGFDPAEPQANQPVQVLVTSSGSHEGGRLTVQDPAGSAVPVVARAVDQPASGQAWGWTFTPPAAGTYHVAFTAVGAAEPLAEADLTVEPPATHGWGLPREQYARTYVLLPPGAGLEWVEAIIESGAWERYRWTIGGSADDAGIGALEDKTVIAINPAAWGQDLEAFFQEHYPHTRYEPLTASTPSQLEQKLRDLG